MRIFLSLLLLLFPFGAGATKILASTSHIASIASMISDDVEVLADGNACPAHYSLKPSDITKIEEADLIIYIDDRFESFAEVIKRKATGRVIKITDLDGVTARKGNFHLWLNIDFAKLVLKEMAKEINASTDSALKELDELAKYKISKLSSIKKPVLLSDSLEYLFDGTGIDPVRIYLSNGSVNLISQIESLGEEVRIFIDPSCNFDSIKEKTTREITYFESDKWPRMGYISYYRSLLDGVSNGSIQYITHQ